MTWQTPKTDWKAADVPASSDFKRIEGNLAVAKSHMDAAAPHTGHETPDVCLKKEDGTYQWINATGLN